MYPQGRPPPSEQRQRSLFGSPLPPLYHHHSGKGRTTSERRDGGPDDTPKYTDSSSRPHPKPGLASQAGLLCASRAAYTPRSGAGAPIGRAPVSEQRQRSLFGSPLPPLYHHHSGKGRTTSERRDGGPDDTPKCTDSSSRSPSPPTPKARLASQAGLLCAPRAAYILRSGAGAPIGRAPALGAATAVALWEPFASFIPLSFRQRADNKRAKRRGTGRHNYVHRHKAPHTPKPPTNNNKSRA